METTFGSALQKRRRDAGISQRELARQAGLDFSYISKLENDRLPPPAADTVVLICKVLEIPAEELLALTGKIPSDVQKNISTNQNAQEFLRKAQELGLSDNEWKRLTTSLRELRGRKR